MSRISRYSRLVCSTSAIALLILSPAWADIIVPDGVFFVVLPNTTTTEQISLGDGSTLIVNRGTATNVGDVVVDTNDGTSINVENLGEINSSAGHAINSTGSTLQVDNSGEISADMNAIITQDLTVLHNRVGGNIHGDERGVVVFGQTGSIFNEGEISGQIDGIATDGSVQRIVNQGLVRGASDNGIEVSDLILLENRGTIDGQDHGLQVDGVLFELQNSGIILGTTGNGINIIGDGTLIQNDGFIDGGQFGVRVSQSLGTLLNRGTIRGGDTGISVEDNLSGLRNDGMIIGLTGDGVEIVSGGSSTIINTGTIYGMGRDGINADSFVETVSNSGTIKGTSVGLFVNNNLQTVENSGTIEGGTSNGLEAGAVGLINNSGRIESQNSNGIFVADLKVLQNSGTIIGEDFAIHVTNSTGTNLVLRQGSSIQGKIRINGDVAFTSDPGMNLDLTIEDASISVKDTGGSPYAITGENIVVVDPSGFSASNIFANDVTRSIHNIAGSSFAKLHYSNSETAKHRSAWISGFGGSHETSGSAQIQDNYGGIIAGVDLSTSNGNIFGLFGGAATGDLSLDSSAHSIDANSMFAGGYFHHESGQNFMRASLVAGRNTSDSKRLVSNNLAAGGIETATADYDGYFVSPSLEYGRRFDSPVSSNPLSISFQASYLAVFDDAYSETGVASPLDVSAKDSQFINTRAQLSVPYDVTHRSGALSNLELIGGIDAQFDVGSRTTNASINSSPISLESAYDKQLVRGFVGGNFRREISDGRGSFVAGLEGLFGSAGESEILGNLRFQYVF